MVPSGASAVPAATPATSRGVRSRERRQRRRKAGFQGRSDRKSREATLVGEGSGITSTRERGHDSHLANAGVPRG